jgi:hypothetical protein
MPKTIQKSALLLMTAWLVTTITMIVLLLCDVRSNGQFEVLRYALHTLYVLVLLWYLWRTGPSTSGLPTLPSPLFSQWRYAGIIPAAGVALVFLLNIFTTDGESILLLLLVIATGWILIAWRRQIRLRQIVTGIVLVVIILPIGLLFSRHGLISSTAIIISMILVPLMYVAGTLLVQRTGLTSVQLHGRQCKKVVLGFLWGCLLFIPLGLANAAAGSPGSGFSWASEWWMPASLPFFSGIAEEVWHRLFLVTLIYFLLRPAFQKRATYAVVAAMLFSAITFGLGHGHTLHNFLTTGMLYGLPMAVVFIKRDWEHAVGAHYMINMIPWLMVFLSA